MCNIYVMYVMEQNEYIYTIYALLFVIRPVLRFCSRVVGVHRDLIHLLTAILTSQQHLKMV